MCGVMKLKSLIELMRGSIVIDMRKCLNFAVTKRKEKEVSHLPVHNAAMLNPRRARQIGCGIASDKINIPCQFTPAKSSLSLYSSPHAVPLS
jgi:hypothetical protein